MDDTNVVTEAALDEAVSYTKGCYVGQEIIARIKYRGMSQEADGIKFTEAVTIKAGATIKSRDDKEIGRVTSTTYSPHLAHNRAGLCEIRLFGFRDAGKSKAEREDVEARIAELLL